MIITATLSGLTFSTEPGTPYSIETIPGWFDGVPGKTQPDDRANADGVFGVSKFYRGARPITLTGKFFGSGDDAADVLAWRRLSGVLASGLPETLTVTDPAGVLSSEVILATDAPQVSPLVDGTAAFTIPLLALDPVRYGPETAVTTGLPTEGGGLEYPLEDPSGALYYGAVGSLGRFTLTNDGTADVWPRFTAADLLVDGFTIRRLDTGATLRYDRVVPAGSTVTIDSRTGEVLIDGVSDASTYLTLDQFFSVPAMGSCDVQFAAISTGSGTLTAGQKSGWW